MPHVARRSAIASLSLIVSPTSGILTTATGQAPLTFATLRHQPRTPDRFEQELQDLNVPLCLRQVVAPSVKPMASQKKPVRSAVLLQNLTDVVSQGRHVLRVFDNRQPFAMLVCLYTFEAFQHFVACDRQ